MFLVGLFSWWYGRGWALHWQRVIQGFLGTVRFFSIVELMKTLLAPYRQISAQVGGESFSQVVKGFFDQLFSRIIGFIVRTVLVVTGVIVIIFRLVYEIIIGLCWWALPLLSVVAVILFAIGWVPAWR